MGSYFSKVRWLSAVVVAASLPRVACGQSTYYVSALGNDGNDGLSPDRPWRSLAKVSASGFLPGDQVLFRRGDSWRESLSVSSSGTADAPVIYGAYGGGAKPRFYGSDILAKAGFSPVENSTAYRVAINDAVGSVLVDHQFLRSAALVNPADPLGYVQSNPGSWYQDGANLYVNSGLDPGSDAREYSAAVRQGAIVVSQQNHVIVRDLAVDETAAYNGGYGVYVFASDNVRMESVEAYRAGKHHIGVINSDGFVGQSLYAAFAMPDQGYGGATAYVAFSDHSRTRDSSHWLDCVAEHPGGAYPAFYTHGVGVGDIEIRNMVARDCAIIVGTEGQNQRITISGGHVSNEAVVSYGNDVRIDCVHIEGPSASLALFGDRNIASNILMTGMRPQPQSAAIGDAGHDNAIIHSTFIFDPEIIPQSIAYVTTRPDSRGRFVGNIVLTPNVTACLYHDEIPNALIEDNFYSSDPTFLQFLYTFAYSPLTLAQWQAMGLDTRTLLGDPGFRDAAAGDYRLGVGSPAVDRVLTDLSAYGVTTDMLNAARISGRGADIGAFELQEAEYPQLTWGPAGEIAGRWHAAGMWKSGSTPVSWIDDPQVRTRFGQGGSGSFAVELSQPVHARSIEFAAGDAYYTLVGQPLHLHGYFPAIEAQASASIDCTVVTEGAQAWNVAAGQTLTVRGAVSGSVVHKTGSGTLTALAANSHEGFVVRAGTLRVDRPEALGSSTATLGLDGGTFRPMASMTVSRPVLLGGFGGTIHTGAFDVTISGRVSGKGALVKLGSGSLLLTDPLSSLDGPAILGGTVNVPTIDGAGVTVVGPGATLLAGVIRQQSLSISANALVTLGSASNASVLNDLTLEGVSGGWEGTLDLGQSALVLRATPDTFSNTRAIIADYLSSGADSGWTDGGIRSSFAATRVAGTVAVIFNPPGAEPVIANFRGVAVEPWSILLVPTLYGDATLDGRIDIDDYFRIDQGYTQRRIGFVNGDFDGNGRVDGDDYFFIDFGLLGQYLPPVAAPLAAVPEPGIVCLVPLMGTIALRRRRR